MMKQTELHKDFLLPENPTLLKEQDLDESLFLLTKEELDLSQKFKNERRKIHFLLGRAAAKKALLKAGFAEQCAILQGIRGEAIWPRGYCGSISHCANAEDEQAVAIAIAGSLKNFRSLGIDIESMDREITPGLDKKLGNDSEFNALKEEPYKELAILSAKEALFKLLYPLTQTFFGFHDAELIWDEEKNAFLASLKKELSPEFPVGYEVEIKSIVFQDYIISQTQL